MADQFEGWETPSVQNYDAATEGIGTFEKR